MEEYSDVIKDLQKQVDEPTCERTPGEVSWVYQSGVLISKADAETLISLYHEVSDLYEQIHELNS